MQILDDNNKLLKFSTKNYSYSSALENNKWNTNYLTITHLEPLPPPP